jgi:tetratricopeptide (TPR) repeat protein
MITVQNRAVVNPGPAIGVSLIVMVAAVYALQPVWASLPSEDFRFVVGTQQQIEPLPFDEFYRRLGVLLNARDERLRDGQPNPDRRAFLQRVQQRTQRRPHTGHEAALWAVDLLRLGQVDEALDLLSPYLRERQPDYFVVVVLGHIYAERGDWRTALRYHREGLLDVQFPLQVPGLTAQQRNWWAQLDRDYVPHYYRIHQQEADKRQGLSPADIAQQLVEEEVFPLFPVPTRGQPEPVPVRFVNAQGEYEPGRLAPAEQAKLPPDAIAIVQQLLFWHPTDTRLLWLLGELYAARGEVDAASQLLEACTWGRQYGNRRLLMEHRQLLEKWRLQHSTARPSEEAPLLTTTHAEQTPAAEAIPISMRTIAFYFAIVAAIAMLALLRAIHRRLSYNWRHQ